MASELGESAEVAHEHIVEETLGRGGTLGWFRWVAFSAMVMALFSAVGALLAGITANESLMERTEEILEVSRLEGTRLHVEMLNTKRAVLNSLGEELAASEIERIDQYEVEAAELEFAVQREERAVLFANYKHEIFAFGVTLLSIAITMSGMSIVSRRRWFWTIA